jgi:hypothetical protein
MQFVRCWCQWRRGLRRRSAAARLLRLWVPIPLGKWMFAWCECCALSGKGLCDELIIHSEESYREWCVVVCDLETSWVMGSWPTGGYRGKTLRVCKVLPTLNGKYLWLWKYRTLIQNNLKTGKESVIGKSGRTDYCVLRCPSRIR